MKPSVQKFLGVLVALILLGGMIFLRVKVSYESFDFQSSNFTFFWLSGRMLLEGESPYDEARYLAGHQTYGIKWQPNKIFPYPLPLAILCIPLGLLPLPAAYIAWQVVTLCVIAWTIYALLSRWKRPSHTRLLVPLFAAMFFFGPVYLTLHTGSVGAIALAAAAGAALLLDKEKPLAAGTLLALTMLKPPQGLTILLLAGVWLLARKNWKAIYGVALGGIILLAAGTLLDPSWLNKFRGASEAVMERTQGVHSNVWAFAYLACGETFPCWLILGGALSLILLGAGGVFLWKNQTRLTAWEAFNLILPLGFLSTIYLWAYDQITYIIPIVWVVGTLVERRKSYLPAFLFLALLELVSFFALIKQAETSKDLWSLGTTLLTLGAFLWLYFESTPATSRDIPPSA
jgi:hypothetical protein